MDFEKKQKINTSFEKKQKINTSFGMMVTAMKIIEEYLKRE